MAMSRALALSMCCALLLGACAEGSNPGPVGAMEGPGKPPVLESFVEAPTSGAAHGAAGWELLPTSPLTPRASALGVWTGSEVLVIGGEPEAWCPPKADCTAPDFPPLADGAAFDPVAGSWRMITEAPFGFSSNASAVVVDEVVYVLAHPMSQRPGGEGGFLQYVIADDHWQQLPSPSSEASWYQLVRTPRSVVAYLGSDEGGEIPDVVFDPATLTWDELPADPLSPSFDRSMVLVGDDLYLFAQDLVLHPGSETPSLARAARLDLTTREWEVRADSEILGSWSPVAAGSSIVFPHTGSADGGEINNWGRSYPYGGIYNIESDSWSMLPEPPGEIAGVLFADTATYVAADGAVLDLADQSWLAIPAPPTTHEGIFNQTIVAAGTHLFVFGGEVGTNSGAIVLDDAYRWRPAS